MTGVCVLFDTRVQFVLHITGEFRTTMVSCDNTSVDTDKNLLVTPPLLLINANRWTYIHLNQE